MSVDQNESTQCAQMRASFGAELSLRLARASHLKLQPFIPAHWFAAAASESASMYISGFFYGAISIAQAYVEALSSFLAEHHHLGAKSDVIVRWKRLHKNGYISAHARDAALLVMDKRNDFHHLNKGVEQDFQKLEALAEQCINHLHIIEGEVFEYKFTESDPGRLLQVKPEYWSSGELGFTQVNLRKS